jgi:hypothetical protein
MPGNPLVRFDEGRVGRTARCSPSLLLYRSREGQSILVVQAVEFLCISFRGLSQHLDDFEEALFNGGGGRKRKIKFRCQRF